MPTDPLTAVLDQLAAYREHHSRLDSREAAHHAQLSRQLAQLSGMVTTVSRALAGDTPVLARLEGLDRQVAELTRRLTSPGGPDRGDYRPHPAPAWWKLAAEDRQEPLAELRNWTTSVYQPGYGHLAGVLAPCWAQHDLCLYALDIASQLWCALYLQPERSTSLLSAQAEYQVRILPAIAAQLAAETTRCDHHPAGHPRSAP
jgi:hypothetical protein